MLDPAAAYTQITYGKDGAVARVALDRPAKRNALSDTLLTELQDALDRADDDRDIRVVVLSGNGPAFCGGFDLTGGTGYSDTEQDLEDYHRMIRSMRAIYSDIWNARKPIIAKVHGYCVSGGCYLQMLCDITICADDAILGHPAVVTGGVSAMPMWNWLLGLRKAKELLMTGKLIDGTEAMRIGLVNTAVPADQLDAEVETMVAQIISVPAGSVTLTKEGLNTAADVMGLAATFRTQGHMNAFARFGPDINLDFADLQKRNHTKKPG